MKTCKIALLMLSAAISGSAAGAQNNLTTTDNGITIATDTQQKVRIEVIGEKIVRVSAVPADADFVPDNSLITVPQPKYEGFKVTDESTRAVVATPSLNVAVSYADGQVSFYDSNGRLLLAENHDGRTFTPIEVEGTQGYTVRQTWASPDDFEGLYGLGQHQSDEWNYKGKNEELFQYNTKVSVPFVISTGGYGVLWDSYSLCRFGNPNDYRQLSEAFTLYDNDGQEGALTGTYTDKKGNRTVRREPQLNFENLKRGDLAHIVNLPEDFAFNGSTVVYEGEIEASESGDYPFILYYSGYQKVYIDGKEVVPERWRTAWNPNSYKFTTRLEKNRRVPIRIEWRPNGSVAYCGLRVHEPAKDVERNSMSWWGEMQDMIDYYFIAGDSMDNVIHGYRTLTGKAPIMPRWAMGFWQSREKYNTQKEVLATLNEYRNRRIPIDNIVIDWLHWRQDSWGSHEFDPDRFPDPKQMVDSIHSLGGRAMISVWPKFYTTTDHFKEFDSRGWMYRQAITDSILDWVGPGYAGSFYDAYNPDARKLFWEQMHDHYYPLGFDAWWMDASEPNIRDCVDIDYRKALCGPTYLGPSTKYFNAYALMNAEAIYDGQRTTTPDNRRVFLLTRSGFAGQQRYSTSTWSGDIATRWEDMRAQMSAGLNFALSGIPFWTMDIGGFCVEDRYVAAQKHFNKTGEENDDLREWRELNTRWFQFGAFCPLFRSHGQWPFREIYNIAPEDHPAYKSMTFYTRLRYSLMPYLYSLNARVHFDDYTMMRPLAMDFTADVATRSISDQFMLGPALMAAPVGYYGMRNRDVYFPQGTAWYDFYTGERIAASARRNVEAPYGRMPLFVRGGSIVPFGPDIQWSDEKPADEIVLYVYAGADASFTLYEDENVNYNYEKGAYATIEFKWDDASSTLTVGKREGEFPGMLQQRRFKVVKVDKSHPVPFSTSAESSAIIEYDGSEVSATII